MSFTKKITTNLIILFLLSSTVIFAQDKSKTNCNETYTISKRLTNGTNSIGLFLHEVCINNKEIHFNFYISNESNNVYDNFIINTIFSDNYSAIDFKNIELSKKISIDANGKYNFTVVAPLSITILFLDGIEIGGKVEQATIRIKKKGELERHFLKENEKCSLNLSKALERSKFLK